MGGGTGQIMSSLSPKRDCVPKKVNRLCVVKVYECIHITILYIIHYILKYIVIFMRREHNLDGFVTWLDNILKSECRPFIFDW